MTPDGFDWAGFFRDCAALATDVAVWVFLARVIGRAISGVGRG